MSNSGQNDLNSPPDPEESKDPKSQNASKNGQKKRKKSKDKSFIKSMIKEKKKSGRKEEESKTQHEKSLDKMAEKMVASNETRGDQNKTLKGSGTTQTKVNILRMAEEEEREKELEENAGVSEESVSEDLNSISSETTRVASDDNIDYDEKMSEGAKHRAGYQKKLLNRRIHREMSEFQDSTRIFFYFIRFLGRMPFIQRERGKNLIYRVEFFSIEYISFFLTSVFLIVNAFFFATGYLRLTAKQKQFSTLYEFVEIYEFRNHWIFLLPWLFCLLLSAFNSLIWLMDRGAYVSDFIDRWCLSLTALKYDPTDGVREIIFRDLAFILFYIVIATCFYLLPEHYPLFYTTSGIAAMLIFDPMVSESFFHYYFPVLRTFAFILHLYSFICARIFVIFPAIFCKLLENAARIWNLRLGYCMRKISFWEEQTHMRYHKRIPFIKLFLEHKIIILLLRQTGLVFATPVQAFFILKGIAFTVIVPRLFFLRLYGYENPEKTEWFPTVMAALPKSIANNVSFHMKIGTWANGLFVCFIWCVVGAAINSERFVRCGCAIEDGYGIVKRHGFILCESAKEKFFIQSLIQHFPKGKGQFLKTGWFIMNRRFLRKFLMSLMFIVILILNFSPINQKRVPIIECNMAGRCFRSYGQSGSYKEHEFPPETPQPQITTTRSFNSTNIRDFNITTTTTQSP